jgi:hypothetical protein
VSFRKSFQETKQSFKPMRRGRIRSRFSKKESVDVKPRKALRSKPDPKLAAWSRTVRERDNNECQWPKAKCLNRGTLHAHHIATRSRRPDLIYDVDNGIALCFIHHQWVHDHPIEAAELGLLDSTSYELAAKMVQCKPTGA